MSQTNQKGGGAPCHVAIIMDGNGRWLSAVFCPVQKVTGVVCEVYAALSKLPPKAACGICPFLLSAAKIGNVLPTKSVLDGAVCHSSQKRSSGDAGKRR